MIESLEFANWAVIIVLQNLLHWDKGIALTFFRCETNSVLIYDCIS